MYCEHKLGAQIDKVKNVFYMDLHGWYEIWFNGKIKNITILNKFFILKKVFYLKINIKILNFKLKL